MWGAGQAGVRRMAVRAAPAAPPAAPQNQAARPTPTCLSNTPLCALFRQHWYWYSGGKEAHWEPSGEGPGQVLRAGGQAGRKHEGRWPLQRAPPPQVPTSAFRPPCPLSPSALLTCRRCPAAPWRRSTAQATREARTGTAASWVGTCRRSRPQMPFLQVDGWQAGGGKGGTGRSGRSTTGSRAARHSSSKGIGRRLGWRWWAPPPAAAVSKAPAPQPTGASTPTARLTGAALQGEVRAGTRAEAGAALVSGAGGRELCSRAAGRIPRAQPLARPLAGIAPQGWPVDAPCTGWLGPHLRTSSPA